ncbi:hypothetical protein BCV69DRAFT_47342 [Microstroma glucosiphilum]|uniref:Uncharacterized protein n=1 Tax=Pseudomicrostroma glucosiphilum TaxID=1684307 RepID=A0A316U892_9BASI|nr:hypothetical protein BCV69DRAFT_47342 [Pseudomicrostroma glucosiphilum]PWN19195.1 hypothetical protein BCV69DRAFT_47342 [Pseudomicrostroma glucosiphilum]
MRMPNGCLCCSASWPWLKCRGRALGECHALLPTRRSEDWIRASSGHCDAPVWVNGMSPDCLPLTCRAPRHRCCSASHPDHGNGVAGDGTLRAGQCVMAATQFPNACLPRQCTLFYAPSAGAGVGTRAQSPN